MTQPDFASDAERLVELHALAVAADRHTAQETTGATVDASLRAHERHSDACEEFRRRHFPRAGRVIAVHGEVFTLSPQARSIRLVWPTKEGSR